MFRSAPAVIVALIAAVGFVNAQYAQSNDTNSNSTGPWDPPKQGPARLTGYAAWHGTRDGWDMQTIDSVTLFSIIGLVFASGLSLRYGHLTANYSHLNKGQQSARLLSTYFGWYNIATLITVAGFFIVDIGKLWTSMGALHNLTEVGILLTLLFASQPARFKYFYGLQFTYVITVVFIVLALPWPLDALFFKLQGLIIDFALVTQYSRLYHVNKNAEYIPHGPRHGEAAGLLANDELETGHGVVEEEIAHEEQHSETDSIKILILAAVIHLIGNIIATLVVDSFWPFTFFQFTYGVTFPLYAFYIYRQPAAPHNGPKWVQTNWFKEVLVGVGCTLLSFGTVALAALWTYGHK